MSLLEVYKWTLCYYGKLHVMKKYLISFIFMSMLAGRSLAQCWFGTVCSSIPGSNQYYCAWNPLTNTQIQQGCIYSGSNSFQANNCIMANSVMVCGNDTLGNSVVFKNAVVDCQVVSGQ